MATLVDDYQIGISTTYGDIKWARVLFGIFVVLLIVGLFVGAWAYHRPVTNASVKYLYGSHEIVLNCPNPCSNSTYFTVSVSQISAPLTLNLTYTCECTANVTYAYSPNDITTYTDGTVYIAPHIIQPGANMNVTAHAIRFSGSGNVFINTVLWY